MFYLCKIFDVWILYKITEMLKNICKRRRYEYAIRIINEDLKKKMKKMKTSDDQSWHLGHQIAYGLCVLYVSTFILTNYVLSPNSTCSKMEGNENQEKQIEFAKRAIMGDTL